MPGWLSTFVVVQLLPTPWTCCLACQKVSFLLPRYFFGRETWYHVLTRPGGIPISLFHLSKHLQTGNHPGYLYVRPLWYLSFESTFSAVFIYYFVYSVCKSRLGSPGRRKQPWGLVVCVYVSVWGFGVYVCVCVGEEKRIKSTDCSLKCLSKYGLVIICYFNTFFTQF